MLLSFFKNSLNSQKSNFREERVNMKKMLIMSFLIFSLTIFIGFSAVDAGESDLQGVVYIQGHGGHIAVLDLKTGGVARYNHEKPSDALTLSEDGKTLYAFSLDGHAKQIDIKSGKQTEWTKLGKKHCGSNIAPDGNVWVSDMKDGHVYIYNPKTKKLVDSFPVSKSICGISFSKDGKKAYVSDMPGGFINIVDVKTKKVTGKTERIGNYIHRHRLSPDGKEIWQSDGNELKGGKAYGVGYADAGGAPGEVVIIDAKSGKKKDSIIIGGNVHDVEFTPDGKYALVASRQIPEHDDSAIVVVDTKTKRVVKMYSACKKCHGAIGVEIDEEKDGGRPFLCAIQLNWNEKGISTGAEDTAGLIER